MFTECTNPHLVPMASDVSSEKKTQSISLRKRQMDSWLVAGLFTLIALLSCLGIWNRLNGSKAEGTKKAAQIEDSSKIQMSSDAIALTGLKLYVVDERSTSISFRAPASIEPNHKNIQQITPLVTGRVSEVLVSTGQMVKKGDLLVVIASPQVAELHGKLHEAESKAQLAKGELYRVKETANQVNILKAKAKLDEADATLSRNRQLASEGLLAVKDLVAAESDWKQAQAEYEFQKNISLNSEIARAQAELNTDSTEVDHLRDSLRSLDAKVESEKDAQIHEISRIELRAPISGLIIERFVNPGSGTELGKPLLTLADTSTLWVIANVPEAQIKNVKIGMPVSVSIDGKNKPFAGTVSYIDPRISEDTRTTRVRIEIRNLGTEIPIGSFAEVEFKMNNTLPAQVLVPESAVQDINGIKNVFVEIVPGKFKRQPVEIGVRIGNLIPIKKGIKPGDRIVTDGSFLLKSTILRDQFGGAD